MTVQRRFWTVMFVGAAGGLAAGLTAVYSRRWEWLIVFALMIWAAVGYTHRMRCPRCQYPVLRHETTVLGKKVGVYGGFPLASCRNCSLAFTSADS